MNYLEIKTKEGNWVYKTNELGDFELRSDEKMEVEDVEDIHMFYMKQNKYADGDEYEGKKIFYEPYEEWGEIEQEQEQEGSNWLFRLKLKVGNFISKLKNLL